MSSNSSFIRKQCFPKPSQEPAGGLRNRILPRDSITLKCAAGTGLSYPSFFMLCVCALCVNVCVSVCVSVCVCVHMVPMNAAREAEEHQAGPSPVRGEAGENSAVLNALPLTQQELLGMKQSAFFSSLLWRARLPDIAARASRRKGIREKRILQRRRRPASRAPGSGRTPGTPSI